MKSSPNVIGRADSGAAQSWEPDELASSQPLVTAFHIAELVALLEPAEPRVEPLPVLHPATAVKKTEARPIVAAWEPEELVWTPPFSALNWAELEEFPAAGALNAPEETDEAARSEAQAADVNLWHTQREAAELLAAARQQADELSAQARQQADETLLLAQEELERMRGEGYREGWAKAEQEASSVLKAADEIVRQFGQWRDGMFAQSEAILVEMVKQIGRSMFSDGLELDPEVLAQNLNRVLENGKSLGDLKVYLNPRDADRLDPAWREYQQLLTGNRIQMVPSDGIKPGGCFVQGQMGTVDARVETQLRTVLEVFNVEESGESA